MKLLAFDLDGTLTQHKTAIESENRALIASLLPRYGVVIIGAGSCRRIFSQLDGLPLPIIGHYGMQQSHVEGDGGLILTRNHVVPVNVTEMENRANCLRETFGLFPFRGKTIEVHASGMLTFPILGTEAIPAEKLAYDPDRKKRRAIYREVCDAFPEYTVVVGGTSSFDIIPKPYDKYHALSSYGASLGIPHEEIAYFGDDYGMGGNDESIYHSHIRFVPVDDYRQIGKAVLCCLSEGDFKR